jgi:hypothetical protein
VVLFTPESVELDVVVVFDESTVEFAGVVVFVS